MWGDRRKNQRIKVPRKEVMDHAEGDSAAAYHIPIDEVDLVKMSRDAIKKELCLIGQRLSGNKGELLGRLRKALEDKVVGGSKKKSKKKSTKKRSDGSGRWIY